MKRNFKSPFRCKAVIIDGEIECAIYYRRKKDYSFKIRIKDWEALGDRAYYKHKFIQNLFPPCELAAFIQWDKIVHNQVKAIDIAMEKYRSVIVS